MREVNLMPSELEALEAALTLARSHERGGRNYLMQALEAITKEATYFTWRQ